MEKKITIVDLNTMEPTRGEQLLRYNAITSAKDGSERLSFHVIVSGAGRSGTVKHEVDQIIYIVEGSLVLTWEGESFDLGKNMLVWVPGGKQFDYRYGAETTAISVFSPAR